MKFESIWNEGKYFDLWSIIHLLAGGVLGSIFIFLRLKFWKGFFSVLFLSIIWEIIEWIPETIPNKIIDIFVVQLGVLVIYYLYQQINKKTFKIIATIITILLIGLSIWSWSSIY